MREAVVILASLILGGLITHVSGWWWWHRRRLYELTYSVVEDKDLAPWDPETGAAGSIAGRDIKFPRYVAIRIENTGTEEFTAADFEQPIRFELSSNIKHVRIGRTSSKVVRPRPLTPTSSGIPFGFHPLLLKPGEWFELEAFAELDPCRSRRITTTGRVQHIDALRLADDSRPVAGLPDLLEASRESTLSTVPVRPLMPIAYAGILIVVFLAIIGFAAFSGAR